MHLPLSILSLATVCVAAAQQSLTTSQYAGYTSAYSFNIQQLHSPRWMTNLPDAANLTSLSIPGTHDTMTSVIVGPTYQCQNHHLRTQLSAGLRYFDIRGRVVNDSILIYHQDEYTNYSYVQVLQTFFSFLDHNPGEIILMRLKEESTPINSTTDFLTLFNTYRLKDPTTAPGCFKHFYVPPFPGVPTPLPTLAPLRGKILILQNFGSEPAAYGVKWESNLLSIEDDYDIPDLPGLDEKWEAVEQALGSAANGTAWDGGSGDGMLYLTHLSASVGVLPIEAAAGDKNGSVVGINDRAGQYLRPAAVGDGSRTGVVIMDFPGRELVREVLRRN